MRPRFLIYTLIFVLAFLAVIFLFRPVKQPVVPLLPQESVQSASNSLVMANGADQNVSSRPQPISTSPVSPKLESDEGKVERLVREFNESHYQPIEFYGQIIDQDSNGIPNVKIGISILQQQMSLPTASGDFPLTNNLVRLEKETGTDGHFEITGENGQGVTIESIQKDGYEVEPDYCPHSFAASGGTSEDPIIFKMWSTNVHEQLITGSKSFQIVPDGKPNFINLTTGKITQIESGDLKIWIKYPEQTEHGTLYDWSCEIDVINGGLQQGDSYSMFSAPADGYAPEFSLQQQIKGGQRGSIGDKKFYIMLNNGKIFGRMQIDLIAPYNTGIPGMILLSYAINPSGSRILR